MIVGSLEIQLMADIARLQRDMNAGRQVVSTAAAGMERAANSARNALAGIGAGIGLQQIGQMVDQYVKFTSQLKLATQSQREYNAAYADVKRIAAGSTQGLQETGVLYARIANGVRELGVSQRQVAAITETVNLSLLISGATASEAASAQLQLSQAFASGTLRGEEFNSVNEAAPRLMKALADGIGVPVGALKKMAEEGLITSEIMANVLPRALQTLREEAKSIQTISGSFVLLKNNTIEFVGSTAQASGAVSAIASLMTGLANNLHLVAGALLTVVAVKVVNFLDLLVTRTMASVQANNALIASNLATAQANATATAQASLLANARLAEIRAATVGAASNIRLALTTNGLVPAQRAAAAAAATHSAAMFGLVTAQSAAAASTRALNAALAITGGPFGLIITILGIAATAWGAYEYAQSKANEKAAADTKASAGEITENLSKVNAMLRERIALQNAGASAAVTGDGTGSEELRDTLREINALKASGRQLDASDQIRLISLQGIYSALNKEIQDNVDLKRESEANGQIAKDVVAVRERLNGVNQQYIRDLGVLKSALDKGAVSQGEYTQLVSKLASETYKASDAYKASETRSKEAATASKQQAEAYRDLISSLQDRVGLTAREAAGLRPLNDAEKAHLDLTKQIAEGKIKLSKAQEGSARSLIDEARANDALIKSNADWAALQQQLADNARDLAQDRYALITSAQQEAEQNERLVETFGMSEDAIIRMNAARLMEQETKRLGRKLTEEEIADLNRVIELRNRSADAAGKRAEMDAGKKAAEQAVQDWKRASEDINRSLTDALLRGFESGKGFGKNLVDTIRNLFNTLVLRPVISAIVNPVAGLVTGALGLAGTAQAATGGGATGVGSVVTGLGTLGSLTSGVGLLGAGGLGLQAGFGALMSSGFAGIGAAVSGGVAAIGAGTGASIAAGMGTIAGALGPIALGIGAAVAIWKKFDTSGTKHTGGAATSSSAGTSAIKAQSLNMADIATSAEAQKMVEGLTQGIVGILDSTALAFGKTAGYTAATAFADDTSKDGAWGSLMIQKLGQTVVNWQDTRGGTKWAPKTFADGEKGQEQYLAALTSSVRGALDSIGLPDWARTMLNGVASNASLENLAQVVEQINVTQAALGAMRSQLIGFSSMSDSAVSALMAAAGGIDKLFGNASAYYDAFYTEAEKNAVVTEQVAKSLAAVNLQMPATKEGYRALLEAQMKLGPAGAESVAVLFASAAAFAQVTAEAQSVADKNAELEASLAKYRSALTDAYNAESDAISSTIDRMGSFAASLRGLRESALLGDLSPLSPQEKYAEAKAQYETVLAAARSGDESAQSNYSAAFNSFLTASRAVFASSGQYQADFAYAQASTAEAERWAGAQVDVGKAQLDALKLSVSGLITLDKSVLSVRDAILQMHQVMGTTAPPTPGALAAPQINMPTPVMYASYGADNTVALVAELKSVRQELASLRADQAAQTGHVIEANARAARENAERVAGATTTGFKSVTNSEQRVALA